MKAMFAKPSCITTATASAPFFVSMASDSCFRAILSQPLVVSSLVSVKFRWSSRSKV